MATLLRTNVAIFKHIPRVIYHQYLPVKTDIYVPLQSFFKLNKPEGYIMRKEDFTEEMMNDHIRTRVNFTDKYLSKDSDLINNSLNDSSVNQNSPDIKEFINNDTHYEVSYNTFWDITDLVRKLGISGKDLFLALGTDNVPDLNTLGIISHQKGGNSEEALTNIWNDSLKKKSDRNYVHFDWINGVGIKNSFAVDTNKDRSILDMRRFNERNYDIGYDRLIDLFNQRICEIKNGQRKIKEIESTTFPDLTDYNKDNFDLEVKLDPTYLKYKGSYKNDIVEPFPSNNYGKQGYFNRYGFGEELLGLYSKDMKPQRFIQSDAIRTIQDELANYRAFIEQGIKDGRFDLERYFQHEFIYNKSSKNSDWKKKLPIDFFKNDTRYYKLDSFNSTSLENLSIVNCLIFGKTNVRTEDIDKLIGLVRYKVINTCTKVIDNFILDDRFRWDGDKSLYLQIQTDSNEIDSLDFPKTINSKLKVAGHILQIMNELDLNVINTHNYEALMEYIWDNDHHKFSILASSEKNRIESLNFA